MNIRRNVSLGHQILFLPFIALLGFVTILLIYYSSVQTLQRHNAQVVLNTHQLGNVREIQMQMNKAQLSEKRYLLHQNIDDLKKTVNAIDHAIANLTVLSNEETSSKFRQDTVVWMNGLSTYRARFLDMAAGLSSIGTSADFGLRKTLLKAWHSVQDRAEVYDPKLIDLSFKVHRAEQAYIAGGGLNNVTTWTHALARLGSALDRAPISDVDRIVIMNALGLYKSTFQRLVKQNEQLLKDEAFVNRESATLVQTFSNELKEISDTVLRETRNGFFQTQKSFLSVIALIVIIATLVFAVGRWVATGICGPLNAISNAMTGMADGNLAVDIPATDYSNQIGDMAASLEKFREGGLERRRARLQLREANRQTQNVFRSMNEALFEVDNAGQIIMANPAAEALAGAEPGSLTGQNIANFLPVSNTERPETRLELLKSGIEELFQNDPEKYNEVIETAPLPLIGTTRDGTIVCANHKAQKAFGYDDGVLVGTSIKSLVPEEVRAAHDHYLANYDKHSSVRMVLDSNDLPARRKDGTTFQTRIGLVPVVLDDEDVILCVLQRPGIDPRLTEIADTPLGKLVSGDGVDMSVLNLVTPTNTQFGKSADTFTRADGQKIMVSHSGALMRDRDNKVSGAICVVTDVTERQKTESEIMRFKSTLDSTSDAVFMFHPDDLKFIYLNEEAKRQTGWPEGEYQNKTPVDMNPLFDEKRFRLLTKPLVFGTQKALSLTTNGLNGKEVELTVELFAPDDNDPWYVVTTRDISKRQAAERENRQLRKTLDQIKDEVYMFTPDTLTFLYQNKAARELSGWSSSQYTKKTLMENNPDFVKEEFLEVAAPLLDGEKKQVIYRKTGKQGRPIEVSLQLIKPEGGKPRFVAITRDISEQLAAEKAKSNFISTVSHELRTPLTSIKGALGIIEAGAAGELNPKTSSLISIASTNANRLIRLINDILDVEKLAAGKMDMKMAPMDLSALVAEAIEANEGYGASYGVTLESAGADTPVMVSGDRDRLMQVMSNLISNAIKFSDKGAPVLVSLETQGDHARISVKDTGAGIPEAAQATIFDKFTQADSSDQRQKGGTGLGLNIVRQMVKAHGGKIDFVSQEGKGTTFFFELELLEQSDSEIDDADDIQPPQPLRLLVCEDDADMAALLRIMLEKENYVVDVADTIHAAKTMLSAKEYAGMTLDLELPDGNGLDLLKDMRKGTAMRDLPVFIVSAHISDAAQKEVAASGVGVVNWLSKPVDQTCLIESLHQVLARNTPDLPAILHVEDDANIRDIVKTIIGDKARVCAAASLEIARKKLAMKRFDLVILDLSLPDGDGQELLPYLNRAPQQNTPVMVFSANSCPEDAAAKVQAELVKSRSTNEEFLNMIGNVLKRVAKSTNRIAAE